MPTLEIEGREVEVGDEFLSMTPEQQGAEVDAIAKAIGIGNTQAAGKPQIVNRAALEDREATPDEFIHGTILPLKRNTLTNEVSFGTPGIAQGIIDALKLPGDVLTGEVAIRDAEGNISQPVIEGGANFAATVTPGGVVAKQGAIAPQAVRQRVAARNVQDAGEFGVDVTRGQATRKIRDQAYEEDILSGGQGADAQAALVAQRAKQQGQIEDAFARVTDEAGASSIDDATAAAGSVGKALEERAAALKAQSRAAFRAAEEEGGEIAATAVSGLHQRIMRTLDDIGALEGTAVAPDMPTLRRIVTRLDGLATMRNAPAGDVVSINWGAFEKVRRQIVAAKASGEEGRALGQIKGFMDQWLQETVDAGLVTGSSEFLDSLKSARGLWARYKSITENPQTIVANIANGKLNEVQIANYLYGASRVGGRADSANVVKEIKRLIGSDHAALEDLRKGVMLRLFEDIRRDGVKSPARTAAEIRTFVNGNGKLLARELYGPEFIAKMNRFAAVLSKISPDNLAANPSRSGQVVMRRLRTTAQALAPLIGFAVGDFTGMIGGVLGAGAMNVVARQGVRRAINNPVPRQRLLTSNARTKGDLATRATAVGAVNQ